MLFHRKVKRASFNSRFGDSIKPLARKPGFEQPKFKVRKGSLSQAALLGPEGPTGLQILAFSLARFRSSVFLSDNGVLYMNTTSFRIIWQVPIPKSEIWSFNVSKCDDVPHVG